MLIYSLSARQETTKTAIKTKWWQVEKGRKKFERRIEKALLKGEKDSQKAMEKYSKKYLLKSVDKEE